MIRKAVIPAGGLGTRLLPVTKEEPKEMLPVFARRTNGEQLIKPLIQLIFEQLHHYGLREFCFIVGRGKRAIEDHFTQDYGYVEMLRKRERRLEADDLQRLYESLENSTIMWVNQPQPKGFGDAILKAQSFAGEEEFIVHAGDTYILSQNDDHLNRLTETHRKRNADATFIIQKIEDPRQYGVIEFETKLGEEYKVRKVIEKPELPASNLAIMPIYIFRPAIFRAIESTPPGKGGEIQLTDAIQTMIDWNLTVYAIELKPSDVRLDIGSPETYWDALQLSYRQ
jgi:UTP--glucose-1-phosphate uridylyltransferase